MNQSQDDNTNSVHGRRLAIVVVGIVVVSVIAAINFVSRPSVPDGISNEEFERVRTHLTQQRGNAPSQVDVLHALGEESSRKGDLETAARCFGLIPADHPDYGLSARMQRGELLIKLDRAAEAEESFREFLKESRSRLSVDDPTVLLARQWLSYLMAVQLRFEERQEILKEQEDSGSASITDLAQLYFPSLLIWNSTTGRERLREFLSVTPDDFQLRLAKGRYLIGEGRLDEATELLQKLTEESNDSAQSLAALLECYFEKNDWKTFEKTFERVPPPSAADPWLLTMMRAQYALHKNEWSDAVTHFENYLSVNPTNTTACMGLSRAYRLLGREADAKAIQKKMLLLAEIRPKLTRVTEGDLEAIEVLAKQCQELNLDQASAAFKAYLRRAGEGLQ